MKQPLNTIKNVLITGGAGYVGSVTVPKLLEKGYSVKVLDLYLYGKEPLEKVRAHPRLTEIQGDIRDPLLLDQALKGVDAVIHLACISNDPSYELNPSLGRAINFDAFIPLVKLAKKNKVQRFIYASSSSVYGVRNETEVTEELTLEPLTDYSKYKALCEDILLQEATDDFTCLILRPATVCGYSPRLRLDLTVNILTNHAINKGEILVFGGKQKRPNIHINDMANLYLKSLQWEHAQIHKKIFNAGYENFLVDELAEKVRAIIGDKVTIRRVPTDDNRSYHVSSKKIAEELGFTPAHTIEDAIRDLKQAFDKGDIQESLIHPKYFNIKRMQEVELR